MGIPYHLTCLLRNLYAGQEATVRNGHVTTDWFQIGKGVLHGSILSPCLFNLYAEYIRRNAGLEEAQAGIKIAGRNINNLRYADDTTLIEQSEEEPKSLLTVRKHLTRGFPCAVMDRSGNLWPLLIPEYSGIKRRGTSFPGLRNPSISFVSFSLW